MGREGERWGWHASAPSPKQSDYRSLSLSLANGPAASPPSTPKAALATLVAAVTSNRSRASASPALMSSGADARDRSDVTAAANVASAAFGVLGGLAAGLFGSDKDNDR